MSEELNRPVAIERVWINPFTFAATVEGLRVGGRREGEPPLAQWQRLYVNFDSWSLLRDDWRFQEIALDGFAGHLAVYRDGELSIQDLLEKPAEETERRAVVIDRLAVRNSAASFEDASQAEPFATRLGPLTFTLEDFRTMGEAAAPYRFAARTEAGEELTWTGTVSAYPLRSEGEFRLAGIVLEKYAPYYAQWVVPQVRGGQVDVQAGYRLSLTEGEGMEPRTVQVRDGRVQVTGLSLVDPEEPEPRLRVDSFEVTGIEAELLAPSAQVERVAVEGGKIALRRDADGLDITRWFRWPESAPTDPATGGQEPGPAAARPDVRLGELAVRDFAVRWEDTTTPRPVEQEVERVEVTVRDVALRELERPVPVQMQVQLADAAGAVLIEGTVTAEPLAADLQVEVTNLALAPTSAYAQTFAAIEVEEGRMGLQGRVQGTVPALQFAGQSSVENLRVVRAGEGEREGRELVSWQLFGVEGVELDLDARRVQVERVRLVESDARVAVEEDGTLSVLAILPSQGGDGAAAEDPPADDGEAAEGFAVTIGRVELENARVAFQDRSVDPPVRLSVTETTGSLNRLSTEEVHRGDIELRARINGSAPLAITGQLSPLGPAIFADFSLNTEPVDLAPVEPYLRKYAGYRLQEGSLAVEARVDVEQGQLDSNLVATLHQFNLGEQVGGEQATSLPVGLAVALLKDSSGRIVLDIPIQGSLQDPQFDIGNVIQRAIGGVLRRAATAPFSLLGAVFGGGGGSGGEGGGAAVDPEELAVQRFEAGRGEVTEPGRQKLTQVARALRERPALRLALVGGFDPGADVEALRAARLEEQVVALVRGDAGNGETEAGVTDEARTAALLQLHAQAFPDGSAARVARAAGEGTGGSASGGGTASAGGASAGEGAERTGFFGWLRSVFGGGGAAEGGAGAAAPSESAVAEVAAEAEGVAPEQLDPAELAAELREQIDVSTERLRELARTRAEAVRQALLAIEPELEPRVEMLEPGPGQAQVDLELR